MFKNILKSYKQNKLFLANHFKRQKEKQESSMPSVTISQLIWVFKEKYLFVILSLSMVGKTWDTFMHLNKELMNMIHL